MVTMAKQIITDEESMLKRQARRRLIGAIALTVMVVVLLPMVLDSEPPVPSQDIALQIPDKDKVGEFVPKMVLPPLNANEAASQPASAPVIAPLLDVKPVASVAHPVIETKPVVESKPAIKANPESVSKPKAQQTDNKPKASAKPAAKPTTNSDVKPHTGFIVQVGAFANVDAAKKLQEKLHKQGYPSYTEKSGNKVRVRVGGYATHAEAERIRRKLEIQGMQPDVVNLN